jgi:hypothetical protein
MSLLQKTSSVLNISNHNNYKDLSNDYNNINPYDIEHENQENNNFNLQIKPNLININESNINFNNINSNMYNYNYNYSNKISDNIDKNIYNNNIITQEFSFKQNVNEYNPNNNNSNSINNSEDIGYINERYSKIIEENNLLKDQLMSIDSQKNETKKRNVEISAENSNLQLKIQKLIENEKLANEKYQNDINEKNKIITALKNHISNLKDKINLLSNENICLLQNIQNLNNKIMNLTNDKKILIEEMSELNHSLSNRIKPKLLKNEDYLQSLEKQFASLKKNNDSLIENDKKQQNLLNIFKKENNILKNNIESYNSINIKEEPYLKEINANYQKNKSKSITNNNITRTGIKKFPSLCNLLNKEQKQKQKNKIFKINNIIELNRNSIDNNAKTIKKSKKLKNSLSEKNINYFNPDTNNRNEKKSNIRKKNNKSNNSCFRSLYMKNYSENDSSKIKNKYLNFNTSIRKKDKNNDKNKNKNYCNRTTKTKPKIPNFELNLKFKNSNNVEEEKKDNYLIANQINKYNLSQNKSFLSSYTEDIYY